MRRVLLALCVLALQSASGFTAQSTSVQPQKPDAIGRLLRDLEQALQRGRA